MNNMDHNRIEYLTPPIISEDKPIWVNPVGGLGDIIMLSTALMRSYEKFGRKFRIVRRSQYTRFFINHPAVESIGNPCVGDNIICNDYWSREEFNNVETKALTIMLKIFGVEDNDDKLFLPVSENPSTAEILKTVPWGEKNVAISFSSESPRKMMHPIKWHIIVEKLLAQRCFVIQLGQMGDIPIKGAYSLLGATTPDQVVSILEKVDAVITLDNFIMHAAKVAGKPTVSLFGPTEATRYAYKDHISLQANIYECPYHNECLGPHHADNYSTQCPLCESHCMNQFNENQIVDIIMSKLNK